MSLRTATIVGLALLSAAPPPADGQTVRGTVLDDATERPIPHAEVAPVVDDEVLDRVVLTDTLGRFRVDAPDADTFALAVEHMGFRTVRSPLLNLGDEEEVVVEIRMDPDAVLLNPLTVVERRRPSGPLAEFYDRAEWSRKTGFGDIFTREDIERRNPLQLSHMLEGIPGLRRCPPAVYVDGIQLHGATIDEAATPLDVEGMEVYRGVGQIPPRYLRTGHCAVVLIWTRRGTTDGHPFSLTRVLIAAGFATLVMLPTLLGS